MFKLFMKYFLKVGIEGLGDVHFSLMHKRCDVCHSNFNFVGKLETESSDRKFLLDLFHLNVTRRGIHLNNRNRGNLGKSTSKVAKDYFKTLSKNEIEKFYEIYRLDFEMFGYDFKKYY